MTEPIYRPAEHPLLVTGADVRSLTRRYGDTDKALGGAYLDTVVDEETGAVEYLVVDTHHGRPQWHRLDETDVDYTVYTGLLRKDVLKDRIATVAIDMGKGRAERHHLHVATLVRLQAVTQ